MTGSSTLSALLVGALACACVSLFCSEEASAGAAWYVDDVTDPAEDGSAAHPFDAIQEGIDAAVNGDTVIVLDGTYSGAGNRDLSFAGKAITLTSSNGPEACIIDCEAAAGLVFSAGEGFDAVVAGFTITRGNPGIVCFFRSTPTIANNIIIDNTAVGESGAGISCFSASPIITGNVITGNEAGLFGGGIYCRSVSSPTITNNVIADNEAADKGGGIAIHWTSSPPMANNTITGNRASVGGGIYVVDLSAPSLINSIVWGNSAAQGAQIALAAGSLHGSSLSVSYCDVEGGQADAAAPIGSTLVWGPGNIDLDPLFADADGGDYHLKSRYGRWDSYANTGAGAWAFDGVVSPCIDAGDPASNYSAELTPNAERVNMGAYGNTDQASRSGPWWTIPADMNDDCMINILDLIHIRNHLHEDPATGDSWKYDPDEDGSINILDMILVRNNLGERCR